MKFITTRVKNPEEDDLVNMKEVMKFIKGTLGAKLNLRSDSLTVIKWLVYVSFDTHNDYRGYTGGMMSLGAGAITSGSWKKNINGRSSTEKELIGVNDMMGPVLWALYFIQGQGYNIDSNIMFQDKHSTMHLMPHGKK